MHSSWKRNCCERDKIWTTKVIFKDFLTLIFISLSHTQKWSAQQSTKITQHCYPLSWKKWYSFLCSLKRNYIIIAHTSRTASDVSSLPRHPIGIGDDAAVIVIDGTWSQAKGLYSQNPRLHDAVQVSLIHDWNSEIILCSGSIECWCCERVCNTNSANERQPLHFGMCGAHTLLAGKWWWHLWGL